jgi:hypothetical protein
MTVADASSGVGVGMPIASSEISVPAVATTVTTPAASLPAGDPVGATVASGLALAGG